MTAHFRSKNKVLRHALSTFFFDRKKNAVETKQAKNSSFDVVGSQQIFKASDRKEAVKRVKRNLVPCLHTVGLNCLYCLHEGVCVYVRVYREAGYEGEAHRAVQIAQDNNMFFLPTVRREKDLYNMRLCTACTVHERVRKLVITTLPQRTVADPYHEICCSSFRQQKINNAYKTTAVYLSLCSVVIDAEGLQS